MIPFRTEICYRPIDLSCSGEKPPQNDLSPIIQRFREEGVDMDGFDLNDAQSLCIPGILGLDTPMLVIGSPDPEQEIRTILLAKNGALQVFSESFSYVFDEPRLETYSTCTAGTVLVISGEDGSFQPVFGQYGRVHAHFPDFLAFDYAYAPEVYIPGKYFRDEIRKIYPYIFKEEEFAALDELLEQSPLMAQILDAAIIARQLIRKTDKTHGIFYGKPYCDPEEPNSIADILVPFFAEDTIYDGLKRHYAKYRTGTLELTDYLRAAHFVANTVFPYVQYPQELQVILEELARLVQAYVASPGDEEAFGILARTDPEILFKEIEIG